jgi:hypothetical protein
MSLKGRKRRHRTESDGELRIDRRLAQHPFELLGSPMVDRAHYGTAVEFRAARAAAWATLIESGATLTDIGKAVGLSRERVRQILRAQGYEAGSRHSNQDSAGDPRAVIAALREPGWSSISSLAYRAHCPPSVARRVLLALGLWPAAQRLWRLRARLASRKRAEKSRQYVLDEIRAFVRRNKDVPTIADAGAGLLPFAHTTAVRHFGTWSNAIRAAGFTPRQGGGAQPRRRTRVARGPAPSRGKGSP